MIELHDQRKYIRDLLLLYTKEYLYRLLDYFQYNESREKADHGCRNGPYVTKNKEKSQNLFLKNFYHKCQISWICSKIYHRMIWLENWNYTLRITFTVLIRLSSNFAGW